MGYKYDTRCVISDRCKNINNWMQLMLQGHVNSVIHVCDYVILVSDKENVIIQ